MIHLHSLGQCMISLGATRLLPTARLMFASALYVTVEGSRSIARDSMAALFWPELDEERATHSLRQVLYRLRAQGMPINADAERVVLAAGMVSTDYDDLLGAAAACPVGDMLARIPGGFLPGYIPTISQPFAEWVEAHRERVNSVLRRQLVSGIVTLRAAGDWPATQALAQRCLELDPLNEEATLAYAEAMAMDGSKARAIMIIDRYMNEIGPRAKELYLPATTLKKRIADLYPLPPVIEREPPQIGREAEMEKLDAALNDARQGRGSAFLISGPPGMGKTRLVTEFTRAAHLKGIRIARSQMGRHDDHRPLGAWSDLVPLMQRMPGALGCDPESLPYLTRLTTYDSKQTTPSPESQDAEYLFARIRMSILDLVGAVSSESCIIVLIEDVHWMDEWSWDVMSALTKRLEKTGVLILMTRRDGDDSATPAPKDAVLRGMPLEPLDEARCRKLLGAVGPSARVAEDDFTEWCVSTCAGNPYFLIELGRRASKTDGRFQAPPSLTRLISERFLDVAPLSRRVLQAAAILGRNSTLARIESVLAERRVSLLDSLDELAGHSLILTERDRVICRHDLLGISALTEISALSLQMLHRHAAQVLESEINEQSMPSHLWDAAQHWEAASERERALQLLERCAARAMDIGTPVEAVRVLNHLLALLPVEQVSERVRTLRIRALYFSREYAMLVESVPRAHSHPTRPAHSKHDHSVEELFLLDARLFAVGPSIEIIKEAMACAADNHASPDHRVGAALIGCKAADFMLSRRDGKRLKQCVDGVLHAASPAIATEFLLVYHGAFGSITESAARARLLMTMRTNGTERALRIRSLLQCSVAFYLNGELEEANASTEEAFNLAVLLQMPTAEIAAWDFRAGLPFALGEYDAADALLAARFARMKNTRGEFQDRGTDRNRARIALSRGDLATATQLIGPFDGIWDGHYPREQMFVTEVRVRLLMMRDGWIPSDQQMARLLRMHRHGRHYSLHDTFLLMLLPALVARGESSTAAAVAQDYVTHYRRERAPLLPQLRTMIESVSGPIPH